MSAKRNAVIVALAGMAAFVGNTVVKSLPFAAASFSAVEFLNSPEDMREWRAGFEEVSDDWDSWAAIWADSTETMEVWGARLPVFYFTEDEVIELYQFRSNLYGQMVADSITGAFCSLGVFADEELPESGNLVDDASIMRPLGRSFGKYHEGRQPWVPPVDLEDEAVWVAFGEYFDGIGRGQLFNGMLDIMLAIGDPARGCQVQSELYRLAAKRAQNRVGAIRLIDFVRSIEALGVGPLPGTLHVTETGVAPSQDPWDTPGPQGQPSSDPWDELLGPPAYMPTPAAALDFDPTSVAPAELDYTADPNFGPVALEAGFTPDPNVSEIFSFGGSVDTSYLGGDCVGNATRTPDVRLTWSGASDELRIFFTAEDAGEDFSLVMHLPDATWVCNDDYAGSLDPLIILENPPEGQYDIWVGSYQRIQLISGTLGVTELELEP